MTEPASRPVLAPGLRVLQRSRDELQVGLAPAVCLPATEPVRRTLGHLLRGESVPDDRESRAVLDALRPVLVDGAGLLAPDVAPGDLAALALRDPTGHLDRLAARRRARVAITGTPAGTLGPVDPRPLLRAAGVGVVDGPAAGPGDGTTVVLVLAHGEVDRDRLDPLLRDRVPHLVVRLVEGDAVVGPFVDPGRTACLRCLDAHAAADDPRRAALVTLHARAGIERQDGVADPVDTALATLAVAWAVRDLLTHLEGERPSTWSATVRLTPTLAPVTHTEWLRHPACGCSWLPGRPTTETTSDQASRTMSV